MSKKGGSTTTKTTTPLLPPVAQMSHDLLDVLGLESSSSRLLTLSPKATPKYPGGHDLGMYASSMTVVIPSGMVKMLGGVSYVPDLAKTLADLALVHVPCEGCVYPTHGILPWGSSTATTAVAAAQVDMKAYFDTLHGTVSEGKTGDEAVTRLNASPSPDGEPGLGPANAAWRLAFGRVLVGVALSRFRAQNPVFNTGRASILTRFIAENLMMANAAAAAAEAAAAAATERLGLIIKALGSTRITTVRRNKLLLQLWRQAHSDDPDVEHKVQQDLCISLVDGEDVSHTTPATMADLTSSTLYEEVLKDLTAKNITNRRALVAAANTNLNRVYTTVNVACSIPLPPEEAEVDETVPEESRNLDTGGFSPVEVYKALTDNLRVVLYYTGAARRSTTCHRTALNNLSFLLRDKAAIEEMAQGRHVAFLDLFASPDTGGSGDELVEEAASLHPTHVVDGVMTFTGRELPDAVIASLDELSTALDGMTKILSKAINTHKRRWRDFSRIQRQGDDRYQSGTAWSSMTMIAMQAMGSILPSSAALSTTLEKVVVHGARVAAEAEAHFASIGLKVSAPVVYDTKMQSRQGGVGRATQTSHISGIDILVRVQIAKPGTEPVSTDISMMFPFPNLTATKGKKKKKKTKSKKRGFVEDADAEDDDDALMKSGDVSTYVSVKCPIQVCSKDTVDVAKWILSHILFTCGFWTPGPEATRPTRLLTPPPVHPYAITSTTVTLKLPQQIDHTAVWNTMETGYGGETLGVEELFKGVVSTGSKQSFRRAGFFSQVVNNFRSGNGCNVYVRTPTGTYCVFVNIFTGSLNSTGSSGSHINAAAMFILCAWIAQAAASAPELNLTTEPFNPDLWRAAGFNMDPVTMSAHGAKIGKVEPEVTAVAPYMGTPLKTGKGATDVPATVTPFDVSEPVTANDIFKRVAGNFRAK